MEAAQGTTVRTAAWRLFCKIAKRPSFLKSLDFDIPKGLQKPHSFPKSQLKEWCLKGGAKDEARAKNSCLLSKQVSTSQAASPQEAQEGRGAAARHRRSRPGRLRKARGTELTSRSTAGTRGHDPQLQRPAQDGNIPRATEGGRAAGPLPTRPAPKVLAKPGSIRGRATLPGDADKQGRSGGARPSQ